MIIAEMAASFTPRSPPTQKHGRRHGQDHEDRGLQRPYTYDGQEEVGHHDTEGDREGQFERTPEALAHRQPQHDDRRYRGEGGPLQPEDEDGHKPGEAGGDGRLEDR